MLPKLARNINYAFFFKLFHGELLIKSETVTIKRDQITSKELFHFLFE